jgi:alpha-tubulin suppressor-like RCC1 family protein
MPNISRTAIILAITVAAAALLSSCGKSSSTPSTIPNSATTFYVHNLVFRNSSTLSTGYNAFGQLGTGDLGNRTVLGPLSDSNGSFKFNGFAMGGVHSVAFFNNSTVRTWGYNAFGQLGTGTTTFSSTPVAVKIAVDSATNLSGITAVAAGGFHTLALKKDGTLWAWGQNSVGQLGVGASATPDILSTGYSVIPVKVGTATVSSFSNISSIAANGQHSLVRANGLVWAWGLNSSGQLGKDPANTGVLSSPDVVVFPPTAPQAVSAVAAGGGFNYALKDGTVWAWGANDNGQLGNNTTDKSFTPVQVLKKNADGTIAPLTGVVQIAAGIQHGLARLADNTVWAWGYNFFGQLGNNQKSDSPVAVQVLSDTSGSLLTGATDIRAFGSSSMALIGGAWYVWGDNSFGQLGTGSNGTVPIPVRMSGF